MKTENFDPLKAMPLDKILENFSNEQEIRCAMCNQRHFPDEQTFFAFYGNVTIGLFGGMIGNNINEDGTIGRISFLCRKKECFEYLTKYLAEYQTIDIEKCL